MMEDFDTHKGSWIQNQLSICHFLETLSLVFEASLLSPKLKRVSAACFPMHLCVYSWQKDYNSSGIYYYVLSCLHLTRLAASRDPYSELTARN